MKIMAAAPTFPSLLVSGAAELHQVNDKDATPSPQPATQLQKENARHRRAFLTNFLLISSLRKLGDLMREPRYLSARIVLVNDVALRCLHELRFCVRHCLQRCSTVAALDRLFDSANCAAHLGAARLVDNRAAGNLARRLLGGRSIGHGLKCPSAVIDR
jgi:hypothetical protein